MPEKPGGTEISELAALKALAQPRRQQILQHLTLHGPATSAILARALGLNTGATSYHLRELARYGFVTGAEAPRPEATGPAARRARWWRAVPGDLRFPPPSRRTPGMRAVMEELNHHAYAADLELFERLQRESGVAADGVGGDDWADAHAYSRGALRLTLPEVREFFEEYIALMNRYKRPEDETPPGARTVHTRLLVFPEPAAGPPPADDPPPAGTAPPTGEATPHQAPAPYQAPTPHRADTPHHAPAPRPQALPDAREAGTDDNDGRETDAS